MPSIYSGATYIAGPFNISGITWEGEVFSLGQNITKTELLSGYTLSVDNKLTGGTIVSVGFCDNGTNWTLPITPSPTPTLTNTPTNTVTPTITVSPTNTVTPTNTPTNTITPTPSITMTNTSTVTPTITTTPSVTPTTPLACDLIVTVL